MSQVGQTTRHRPLTHWAGIVLILALGLSGINDGIHNLKSAVTAGQKVVIAAQFGYFLCGLIAAGALLARSRWARPALWTWAALIALVGGLASVAWGGTTPVIGLVAGAASAAIAALVVWLALQGTERWRDGETER